MTTIYIIGFILLIGVLFVGWGIFGWILRGIGAVFELLFEGGESGCGCLLQAIFWPIFIFFVLGAALVLI